jgi:hypothetical protein
LLPPPFPPLFKEFPGGGGVDFIFSLKYLEMTKTIGKILQDFL